MKKIVCDICRRDIRYNGFKIRFKSIFACFFSKIWIPSKRNSDFKRLDLCEICFNKLREMIQNPNTIQNLRDYLPGRGVSRSPSIPPLEYTPGQTRDVTTGRAGQLGAVFAEGDSGAR